MNKMKNIDRQDEAGRVNTMQHTAQYFPLECCGVKVKSLTKETQPSESTQVPQICTLVTFHFCYTPQIQACTPSLTQWPDRHSAQSQSILTLDNQTWGDL